MDKVSFESCYAGSGNAGSDRSDVRRGEISEGFERCAKGMSQLQNLLSLLEESLKNVLRPIDPKAEAAELRPKSLSPHGAAAHANADMIASACQRLQNIISRVEA